MESTNREGWHDREVSWRTDLFILMGNDLLRRASHLSRLARVRLRGLLEEAPEEEEKDRSPQET
jgi:hypothetical protein